MHIYGSRNLTQSVPLLQQIQSGRAIFKRFKISYTEPNPCSANDHPDCQTEYPASPANSICGALSAKALESHERRHLVIPSQSNQNTLLFHEIRMERAILNSLRMACHRSSTDHVNNTQNRPIFREIRFGCAIFNSFRISHAPSTQCTSCTSTHHADSNTKHNAPPQNPIRVRYLQTL